MPSSNLALKPVPADLRARIAPQAVASLPTDYGHYQLHAFLDHKSGIEHIALVLGEVGGQSSVLTRIHSECLICLRKRSVVENNRIYFGRRTLRSSREGR